jgi:hypothetical protein
MCPSGHLVIWSFGDLVICSLVAGSLARPMSK